MSRREFRIQYYNFTYYILKWLRLDKKFLLLVYLLKLVRVRDEIIDFFMNFPKQIFDFQKEEKENGLIFLINKNLTPIDISLQS